mmetsp:Transcript_18597/g.26959  ORF Transcript_18597/g.26959 Transcript_18597/m.26959 type:complete len:710 (-) Transcript_18597:78-2207(-)
MNENTPEDCLLELVSAYRSPLEMVQCDRLVTEFGRKLPYVGRTDLMKSAKELFLERLEKRTEFERHSHPVAVVGGCSGIGKTRALVSIAESFPDWISNDSQWTASVIITYNNGNPPICDRTLLGLNASELVTADKAFALRLLYFAFIYGTVPIMSFEAFTRKVPPTLFDDLSTDIAVSAISQYCSKKSGKADGILYIGVDEINYLLDSRGDESAKRSFLKATMVALGGAMISSSTSFVFGVVAGTTVLPLNEVFAESGHPTHSLPIGLLHYDHCEAIVQAYTSDCANPALWEDWRLCRQFRTLLTDYSSLPRMGEFFLNAIEKRFRMGEGLVEIDYVTIESILLSKLPSLMVYHNTIIYILISKVMLSHCVSRKDLVCPDVSDKITYGQLEQEGKIVLKTLNNGQCVVQLPYCMFRNLLHGHSGKDMLVGCLHKMCALVSGSNESGSLSWQSFEDLCVYMEAVREMLLARSLGEDKLVSVNDFYCISSNSTSSSMSSLDALQEFALRETCSVGSSLARFSGGDPHHRGHHMVCQSSGIDANTSYTIFKNAPGALFDSFTTRCDDRSNVVLCCGQQKMYTGSTVGIDMIKDEVIKVAESVRGNYILVIIATRVNADVSENIPENCVIVTGKSLENFFGPVFSGRFHLLAESRKVNVNSASYGELKTVPGLGDALIKRILRARNQRAFQDWNDVVSRVNHMRSSVEREITY